MSYLPFNLTNFSFDSESTWLSVKVIFAHLPHLSHHHSYLIPYQIGYWILDISIWVHPRAGVGHKARWLYLLQGQLEKGAKSVFWRIH